MLKKLSLAAAANLTNLSFAGVPDHTIHLRAFNKPDSVYHVALIGESIRIQSQENPSTGYQWIVDEFTDDILQIKENTYTEAKTSTDDGRMGAGGKRNLEVQCQKPGRQ